MLTLMNLVISYPLNWKSGCCAQFVFGTCAAGAVVLTVNVVLLGGNIGFFQSMCLLGYCLFPMDVAAIVTAFTTNMLARWIVVLVSCRTCSFPRQNNICSPDTTMYSLAVVQ